MSMQTSTHYRTKNLISFGQSLAETRTPHGKRIPKLLGCSSNSLFMLFASFVVTISVVKFLGAECSRKPGGIPLASAVLLLSGRCCDSGDADHYEGRRRPRQNEGSMPGMKRDEPRMR